MKVTNNASFAVIGFGWLDPIGYSEDVRIEPGQSAEVNGPYLGDMDGGTCHVALRGEISCHEGADDDQSFGIAPGAPVSLAAGDRGITIRHHGDLPESFVIRWREVHAEPA